MKFVSLCTAFIIAELNSVLCLARLPLIFQPIRRLPGCLVQNVAIRVRQVEPGELIGELIYKIYI